MYTVGIDEVGRGCLAGPLVAGAVILQRPLPGLRDSKMLSAPRRMRLVPQIKQIAVAYGLGWSSPEEIDQVGLTQAVRLAYLRALAQLDVPIGRIIIDGKYNFLADDPRTTTLIHADALIPAVSAASIIAKVARDMHMQHLARTYPVYGFDRHVGYGTSAHLTALHVHGPCRIHRRSFRPLSELA